MKRMGVVVLFAALVLALAGCEWLMPTAVEKGFSENGQFIAIAEENGAGWVEVSTSSTGGTVHWGDSFDDGAYTTVTGPGTYGHYYDEDGVYAVRLMSHEAVLDMAVVAVPHIAGHVELVRTEGSTVVVAWYGPADRNDTPGTTVAYQWIVWGDSSMTTVTHHDNGNVRRNEREHTYTAPGTYEIGIRGDINGGDAYRACFTVTVH